MSPDGDIGVANQGGQQEDSRSGRESYDQTEVPEDKVPADIRIEIPEGSDGAPTPGKIGVVEVRGTDRARAEIESARDEDALGEVAAHGTPACEEGHLGRIERKEKGGPKGKKD